MTAAREGVRPAASGDVVARYGQALVRSSSVYAIGVGVLVPLGLVSLAVTTRYLDPAEYGRLAILFAAAGVLTILAGIGVIQGTLMLVFRGGDDDGDDDGADLTEEDAAALPELATAERKRILGSGLLLAAIAGAVWTVPLAIAAGPVSSILLGDDTWAGAVRWMLLSAWGGSVWRLVHQVWRYERRPGMWLLFQTLRPAVAIAGSAGALIAGYGVAGVLAANAIGTLATIAVSAVATRRSFVFRPRWNDGPRIFMRGIRYAPMILASLTQTHVSVFVVAALTSAQTVGIFQVAARLAMVPAYFGDGIFLGWPSLARGPLGVAVVRHKGRAGHAAGIFSFMAFSMISLLVVVSLTVGVLIHIAADDYSSAADLVPLLAAGSITQVLFRAVYRTSRFRRRMSWYVGLHYVWVMPYAVTIAVLAPSQPTWAVAGAQLVAGATVIAILVRVQLRRSADPTPYAWRRLGAAVLSAAACVLAVELTGTSGVGRVGLTVAAVAAFPVGLVVLGALRRDQVVTVLRLVVGLVPRRPSRPVIEGRLARMRRADRDAFTAVAWGGLTLEEAADRDGVDPDVERARFVRGLRAFADLPGRGGPLDVDIGRYLLHPGIRLERDDLAQHLGARGVDPFELHRLEDAARDARRVQRRGRAATGRAERVPGGLLAGTGR